MKDSRPVEIDGTENYTFRYSENAHVIFLSWFNNFNCLPRVCTYTLVQLNAKTWLMLNKSCFLVVKRSFSVRNVQFRR